MSLRLLAWALWPALLCFPPPTGASEPLRIHGFVERVRVEPGGFELKARLDTGAQTSSIDADGLEVVEHEGRELARFQLDSPQGESLELELPVERWVRIKRKLAASQRRPVIRLTVCLGDLERRVEFSLAERDKFNYPVLLGRNFLAGHVLVDSAATFTQAPTCSGRTSH